MLLAKEGERFVAYTRFEEKDIPKNAGFKWEPIDKHWYTKDPTIAAKLYGYADASCRAELEALSTQYDKNIQASKSRESTIIVPCPADKSFMPYQLAGIEFFLPRRGIFLGDDMGLGKTVQVIGFINLINEIENVLVVCPNSIKLNWRDELSSWLVRKLSVGITSGRFLPSTNIVIINYEMLSKYHKELRDRKWDLVVADECHFCKSVNARRTIEVVGKKVRNAWVKTPLEGKWRVALTGTPILNRPIELFPVLNWLDPQTYDNWFQFGLRFCNGHRGRWGWDFSGYSNLKELQQKLRSTVMIRRRKEEVLTDLPPKIRQVIEIPANDETLGGILKEREVYENAMSQLQKLREAAELAKISDNQEDYHDAIHKLKECQRIAFIDMARIRHDTAVLSMPIIAAHIRETLEGTDGKIVIFAHHHDVINGFKDQFPGMCAILTGEQNINEKDDAVNEFVNNPACRLFIGSIKAAGLGLNKLQLVCSHAIFAEEDWVPAWITQCEDRLHRFGQKSSVLAQHYVLEGSITAMMAKRTVLKQNISDRALDKGLEAGQALTLEELSPSYTPPSTEVITPDRLSLDAQKLNAGQIKAIHQALKMIAGMCDGAQSLDGAGFSKFDARLGRNLAEQERLTPKAAALGRTIAMKYHKQLPEEAMESFKEI